MIRANCRARFTAADFDFIVRTLARSQTDQVSLVDLLSDIETRDSILDHPRLIDAILNHCGHLRISSQFYFYVLDGVTTEDFLGICKRNLESLASSLGSARHRRKPSKNNSLFAVDGPAVVYTGSPEIWSGELWR